MSGREPIGVLFVCLGNICRSPTAEAVMRALAERAGLTGRVRIDSAGTGNWHAGEPADERSQAVGRARKMPLAGVARQVKREDFERFDLILALDRSNRADLRKLAPSPEARARVHLLRDFEPDAGPDADVPDPYYGGREGFEEVFDICVRACTGLLEHLKTQHGMA